jgi:predicted DNA-binding transcriptional regulator AlpA
MTDATDTPRRGLSFTQACLYVGGISRPKMYSLIGDGLIQRSYLIGNRRYFFKEELDRFMESQVEHQEG